MKKEIQKILATLCSVSLIFTSFPIYRAKGKEVVKVLPPQAETTQEKTSKADTMEAPLIGEDVTRRTENSKHFRRSDGSYTAVVYGTPVHYLSNGKLVDIDNTLTEDNDSDEAQTTNQKSEIYSTHGNNFHVKFAKKSTGKYLIKLKKDKISIDWSLLSPKNKVEGKKTNPKGSSDPTQLTKLYSQMQYNDILSDTDLQYIVTPTGLKENIIIKKARTNYDYIFELKVSNVSLTLQGDGSIIGKGTNKHSPSFIIPAPNMMDSAGKYSDAVHYELQKFANGKKYVLKIVADQTWMNNANRQFPVTIDPVISTSQSFDSLNHANIASSSNYANTTFSNVGMCETGYQIDEGQLRSFWSFHLPAIDHNEARILSAKFCILAYADYKCFSPDAEDLRVSVHKITSAWSASGSNAVTWNHQPSFDNTATDYATYRNPNKDGQSGYYWSYFDITPIVQQWYDNPDREDLPNDPFGLMLKEYQEGTVQAAGGAYIKYYTKYNSIPESAGISSDYRPLIQINYRDTKGLEPYWTYTTVSAGRSADAYVNNFNGALTLINTDASGSGERMPVTVQHIYNHNTAQWHTNFDMRLKATSSSALASTYPYYFLDEDGTEHYFYSENGQYKDEDGLGYTLKIVNTMDVRYIITDKEGGQIKFNWNGWLYSINDSNNNQIYVSYKDSFTKIDYISDGAGRRYVYQYTGNNLSGITDPAGRTTTFSYENGFLTRITNPDGEYTTFEYDGPRVKKVDNHADGTSVKIDYFSRMPYRVHKITTIDSNQNPISSYSFDYQQYTTKVSDQSGYTKTYLFNAAGQTVEIVNGQSRQAEYYQFGAPGISGSNQVKSGEQNKMLYSAAVQSGINNMVVNPSFRFGTAGYGIYPASASADVNVVWDSTGHNGRMGAALVKSHVSNTTAFFDQSIQYLTAGTYTASAYVKTGNAAFSGDGFFLNVNVFSDGQYRNSYMSETVTKALDGWKRLTATFTIPQGSSISAGRIDFGIVLKENLIGTVYVDDLQIEQGAVANDYNLVENSALLRSTASWTDGSSPEVSAISNLPDYGYALHMAGDPGAQKEYKQTFRISGQKGDVFAFGGWTRAASASKDTDRSGSSKSTCQIRLEFSSGGTPAKLDYTTYQQWSFLSGMAIAPAAYDTVTIVCSYNYNINDAWFTGLFAYKENFGESYTYDSHGNITSNRNQAQSESAFAYNNDKLFKILNPTGSQFLYSYQGSTHNIQCAVTTDGQRYTMLHDSYGNTTSVKETPEKFASSLSSGKIYYIRNAYSGNAMAAGTDCVTTYEWTAGNNNQEFKLVSNGEEGKYCLRPVNLSGRSVAISTSGYPANHGKLLTSPSDSTAAQTFRMRYQSDGTFIIDSMLNTGTCLDSQPNGVSEVLDGRNVMQEPSNADDRSQRWYFIEAGSADSQSISASAEYSSDGNHLTKTTDERGNTAAYSYDGKGLLSSTIDAGNSTTNYTYNADNDRLTKVQSGNSQITYSYQKDRLSSISADGRNVQYLLGYDSRGRRTTTEVGSAGGVTRTLSSSQWNARNLLTCMTYGNGQSVNYIYDSMDRVVGKGYNGNTNIFGYVYDANGRLGLIKDRANNRYTRYTYDLSGRLAEASTKSSDMRTNPHEELPLYGKISYAYEDGTNRISGLVYNMPLDSSLTSHWTDTVGMVYDAGGNCDRVKNVRLNGSNRLTFSYDSLGRVIQRSYSSTNGSTYRVTNYSYVPGNGSGSTTALLASVSNSGLGKLSYTYDSRGNITTVSKDGVVQESYKYDELNQLRTATKNGVTTTYTYDNRGNILSRSAAGGSTVEYAYGDSQWKDLLTSYNGQSITSDEIGNPLSYRDGMNFTWQNGRQMATFRKAGVSASYAYGADGQRVSKTVNGVKTVYCRAGDQNIGYCRDDGTILEYIFDGNGNLYGISYEDSKINGTGNGQTYYFAYNAQGDVIGLYNFAGVLVAAYSYDEWGKCTVVPLVADDEGHAVDSPLHVAYVNPFRYRGYQYDEESGLYYLQSRYYDPQTGRFLNADGQITTGSDLAGMNLFAYCSNNPVNMTDSSGHFPFLAITAIIGAVVGAVVGGIVAAKTDNNIWAGIGMGAAVGGLIGLGAGAAAGLLLAGSATASTAAVLTGATTLVNQAGNSMSGGY
jgi:RHS repeat-associated protein